jgi:hypothetical protein
MLKDSSSPMVDNHQIHQMKEDLIHLDPFHITTPNITSFILSPNLKERIYSVENYICIVIITFFISPKYNTNVTIKGSYNIQRFLILEIHFANFLLTACLHLLMLTHHRLEV